ncbi:MAG TPA: hypothetical protein VHE35_23500 [Kofleriaceae bacterium]|nr:hypothetical protein [Kofleriaceae bacterium]
MLLRLGTAAAITFVGLVACAHPPPSESPASLAHPSDRCDVAIVPPATVAVHAPVTPPPVPRPTAPATPAQQATALALFAQGNDALRQGAFTRAADLYRQALTYWDHPGIHYNLTLALINLDEPLEMYQHLQVVIHADPARLGPGAQQRAQNLLRMAQRQIASVEADLTEPGTQLFVDGVPVAAGATTWKSYVIDGEHLVRLMRGPVVLRECRLDVDRDTRSVRITL